MQSMRLIMVAAALLCAMLIVVGCSSSKKVVYSGSETQVEVSRGKSGGPPPHAPAHGYRRKHKVDGFDLVYDPGRNVYIVVGYPEPFYSDGKYYRHKKKHWDVSVSMRGSWRKIKDSELPVGLRIVVP